MKRRTALGAAGTVVAASLSGCLDAFQEHFTGEVSTPIPIQILNESDRSHNVRLEAYERETNRQSYEESYTVTPGEQVKPPNLRGVEQRFQVTLFDRDGNEETTQSGVITPDTQLVRIVLQTDDVLLEITEKGGEGNQSDGNEGTTGDDESDGNDSNDTAE